MSRVLITGASGLVGSSIKSMVKGNDDYEYIFLSSKECDLRNEVLVDTFFNQCKPDIVIHLANVVAGLYGNISNNYKMLVDNVKINTNILEACKKYKIKRLINILSTCVFGNDLNYPLTSKQMYDKIPDSSNEGYSVSKRFLDTGSKLLTRCSDIEIVSLIPTNLYGCADNFNLHNSHVIPGLIMKTYIAKKNLENNLDDSKLIIKGDGSSFRQFVFSNDLAKIILHFINCKLDKKFNQLIVGPPIEDEITIKDLVNKIVKEFDFNGEILYDSNFSNGQHKKTVSNDELLAYIPDFKFTSLETGLKKTITYFIENYNTVRK